VAWMSGAACLSAICAARAANGLPSS
jgi:hypothetical protein